MGYIVLGLLIIFGLMLVSVFFLRKVQGNMGINIGRKNAMDWGMDEGQEKDWY